MILFSVDEAELLFTTPAGACELRDLIKAYVFTNRAATPEYEFLSALLRKAIDAGVMRQNVSKDGQNPTLRFLISPEWYHKIHSSSQSFANEIDAMIEFTDTFTKLQFESKVDSGYVLPLSVYQAAISRSLFER